jgi:signal transduction histidine kinase
VAWGLPLLLAIFFLSLGFDAPLADLFARWTCVGLAVYLGTFLVQPDASFPQPASQPVQQKPPVELTDQLIAAHRALANLYLPVLLQQFIDEMAKLIPGRGALLILLDSTQEEPEYVVTNGEVSSSLGDDLAALLPREVFLQVLEQKTLIFDTVQELHARGVAIPLRDFARRNLFVGAVRHRHHLAFLLIADRVGEEHFLLRDSEVFLAVAPGAAKAIENARLFAELQERERRQRELLHGLVHAQEQDSKLLATEWHDRVSKKLFEVLQGLRGFLNVIAQRAPDSEGRFKQLTVKVDEVAALVRGLANELHPSVLDDFGVAAAIREYITDVVVGIPEQEPLQVAVQAADDVDQHLPNEAKLTVFRITQEALRNIRRHADAKHVQIAFVQEHAGVSLMIKDDGRGFNPNQLRPGHFGLQFMRERAEACGGTFQVVSAQGQGTEVRVNFPHASTTGAPSPSSSPKSTS